jgi:ABC-type multidrug transport system ATPase subunit
MPALNLSAGSANPAIGPREKFALPGPNGAGKTPLINVSCGIVNP